MVNLIPPDKQAPPSGGFKAIEAVATARDLALEQMWKAKETEAIINARECADQLRLQDIKIVRAEYSYDGARLTFLISGPDDGAGRLETESLRDDMQQLYPQQQVGLRQIGPRDCGQAARRYMGARGLEERCCSSFLTDFSPVSIKMAKEQGLSLNPEEITGMCGRLRCCLVYEYENYVAARKLLPKRGKLVITPKGTGKVVDVNPMKEAVFVAVVEGESMRVYEFMKDDLQPAAELQALQAKGHQSLRPARERRLQLRQGEEEAITTVDLNPPRLPHAPRRVVSLVPSVTASLFDLGLGARLVGRTDACVYPAAGVAALPSVGGPIVPDMAAIQALQPDLVIASEDDNGRAVIAALQASGVPVWGTHPRTVRDALNLLVGHRAPVRRPARRALAGRARTLL